MKQIFKNNWLQLTFMVIGITMVLFFIGCPPTTKSLNNKTYRVTATELKIELETIIATANARLTDLEQQEQLRNLLLRNAQIIVQTATVDPTSILLTILGFYGAGQVVTKSKDTIKKKFKKTT